VNIKGTDHTKQVNSLKKIEGQIRGIIKMIEGERYCIDILHQFKAIQSALTSVELNILKAHVESCIKKSIKEKSVKKTEELIDEVVDIITKVKKGRL
jgi:DNA-binding FrmR family transcriptional regulator